MNQKILIMMLYYERPTLVVEALKSIVRANDNYKNWHLAFHDDSSPTPGEAIVRTVLPEDMLNKVTFYRTIATKEQKLASGGMLGHVMNQMISDSDADIAIILCDDDILHEQYLFNLNRYFANKPYEEACYSHVIIFDPNEESWESATNTNNPLNYYTTSINPENKLDACQVAWRTSLNKKRGVWFPYPCHKNQDAGFYKRMYEYISTIPFSGFISQYKAIHKDQLSQIEKRNDSLELIINHALDVAAEHYFNGDPEEAHRLYKQILKVSPDQQTAIQMLNLCEENFKFKVVQ